MVQGWGTASTLVQSNCVTLAQLPVACLQGRLAVRHLRVSWVRELNN